MTGAGAVGSYAVVALLGAMSPGPDFALVSRFAALRGRRVGLGASAGVAAGMAVNTLAAVFGVGAVVAASPALFKAVAVVGAIYLLYLGVRSLLAARESGIGPETETGTAPAATESSATAFRQGLITNVLNPKSVVFLVALLPQFLTDRSTWLDKTVLGVITVLAVLLWFSVVALAVGALQAVFRKPVARKVLNIATGLVLISLGVILFLVE
ncbi:LysE family translocator [Streptomyces sp. NBC_01267]|uniref:LysE family translocator n=1 Tax=unclassified Streptomyces TaxID=2593676 RepID=UPI002DDC41E9|nr:MULTISPECIES: LysE family translocator [unclassified Streptomyces]WSC21528.1 LysE family translocator [Streptomyces sp. NBC_01766]